MFLRCSPEIITSASIELANEIKRLVTISIVIPSVEERCNLSYAFHIMFTVEGLQLRLRHVVTTIKFPRRWKARGDCRRETSRMKAIGFCLVAAFDDEIAAVCISVRYTMETLNKYSMH